MIPKNDFPELPALIERTLDGSATAQQEEQLRALLAANPDARKYYTRYIFMRSMLIQGAHLGVPRPIAPDDPSTSDLSETMILPAVREEESPPAADPPLQPPLILPPPASGWNWPLIHRFSIAAAAAIILLVIGAILGRPAPRAPAVLVADVDAQWGPPRATLHPGDKLYPGPIYLAAGEAQIQLATGVSLLIEGPARLEVRPDNAADLLLGKVTVTVPPEAVGFTLHAGNAQLVDLGTEFGAQVHDDHTVAVDVLTGKVQAQPAAGVQPTMLVAGQSAKVTASAVLLTPPQTTKFAQVLGAENSLDLCDLLCNGDGTTHRRGDAIAVGTGDSGKLEPINYQTGDHVFRSVPQIPIVDGAFIPDGKTGPQQIDSDHHQFTFPPTLNQSFNLLWIGGAIPTPTGPLYHSMPTRLGGVDYAVLPHGFLAMHSNKGMTLSLDQLRKLHPQKRFSRFRCIAGNTSSDTTPVDLFILVDGIVAFQKKALVGADGPIGIQIPIQPQNRFLTIVSAQSNESMHDNFLLLGDPVLDYASQ